MPSINPIPPAVVEKIAAGEVIVDPLSVVKELVENSIDAGATSIKVYINKGGKRRIKVIDNGKGMDLEDLKICAKRYTTSKIKSEKDLYNLTTLGFRGEALASIAAVSELKIDSNGWSVTYDSEGNPSEPIPSSLTSGTSVEVNNLFIRFPVRLKFLKSDKYETAKIRDLITKYSLVRDDLHIQLYVDNELVFNSPAGSLRDKLYNAYGKEVIDNVIPLEFEESIVRGNGFISKPGYSRKTRDIQILFVNGRLVRNLNLVKYIQEGYTDRLFLDRYPVIVLRLNINPELVDANIHPSKREILIKDDWKLKRLLSDNVAKLLGKTSGVIEVNPEPVSKDSGQAYPLDRGIQSDFSEFKPSESFQSSIDSSPNNSSNQFSSNSVDNNLSSPSTRPEFDLEILGQVNRTYIIGHDRRGLIIIDQHASHERILYEKYLEQFRKGSLETTELLKPFVFRDSRDLEPIFPTLYKYGFKLEPYGRDMYILTAVPTVFKSLDLEQFREIIDELLEDNDPLNDQIVDVIATKACRSAIKAGYILSPAEMKNLIRELSLCRNPYTCPHGRPTILRFTWGDLEHKFKRKD